uniref:Uncharacterized protein n=1 Tax=Anguilla anguilla TaxID=7936 RepID=A0A0E9SML4_ANGAN
MIQDDRRTLPSWSRTEKGSILPFQRMKYTPF